MKLRPFLSLCVALALTGCGARLIPASADTPAPVKRPSAQKPQVSADIAAKPVAATPLAPTPVAVAPGSTARTSGVYPSPLFDSPPFAQASAGRALKAFRISCPSLIKRTDTSGLTNVEDWKPACAKAKDWADSDAVNFFAQNFELVQIGDGKAFATGYYEPEIAGSRTESLAYPIPVYKRPPELVEVDLGQFSDSLKGKKIRGKVNGNTFVPFADRAQIEKGALDGRGLEIAWVADAAEFFFLQVQGSGRLKLPDGSIMRIGYDGQNGRDYTGIGKLMRDRGLLGPGQASMQGIIQYLHDHPEEGRAIMHENKSWVFFKELTGGVLGALGLPVTGRASVAADPAFVPLGAPVFLSMDRADANGLWIAQDTGGAIKGSNRFDTFWGAGEEARKIAGGMSARGTAFVLLPSGVLARIQAEEKARATSPQP